MKGQLITLEGGEGAGKTTLMNALALYLTKKGIEVTTTREPGGTDLGAHLRRFILNMDLVPKAELFLFLADRAQHVATVVRPSLERGDIVLCDRYIDSTLAYQGVARHLDQAFLEQLCLFATDRLLPHLTLLLDLPPSEGLKRAPRDDRIEQEALVFHERVREGFLALAKGNKDRFLMLDATQPFETVLTQAKRGLDALLSRRS